MQDNLRSVLLGSCCVEKSSAAGFPGTVNAKCLLRKFLSLVRSRNFLICLELGHYSFKIHILMLLLSAYSLFLRRVSEAVSKKSDL